MDTTLFTIIAYLILMFGVAWYFSRRESLEAYFLNQRSTGGWLMTLSTVATLVGAGATVAIVAEVYNTGISYGIALPISFVAGMVILGLVAKRIKTLGDQYGAYTLVDFFGKRFDARVKGLTGILQLFLLIIWTAVQAVAMTALASVLTGFDYQLALICAGAVMVLYTSMGGIKLDFITDFIQFWIIIAVFILMAVLGYMRVGGVGELFAHMPAGHLDPLAFGGISWFVGVVLVSGFLYLGNSTYWQRIFSSRDLQVAQRSFYYSIPFLTVIGLLVIFLGLASVQLVHEGTKEVALFSLMKTLLPPALVGLGYAGILAIVMSSVDSFLVAGSTIIYRALQERKGDALRTPVRRARLITLAFGVCGFVLAWLVPDIITLSLLVTYLALIFVPPIFAALYSRKVTASAVFYAISISSLLLFGLFSVLKEQTFVVTTIVCIIITFGYDKIFRGKQSEIPATIQP